MSDFEKAKAALKALLWELPAEFSGPVGGFTRHEFKVIKQSNVRKVHESLHELIEYFGEDGPQ